MTLSNEIVSQFAKATVDKRKKNSGETVYGTIVKQNDSIYVKIDGSEQVTPVQTTADVQDGERVVVMVKNHTALVTGNISSPSARSSDVQVISDKVTENGNTISQVTETIGDISDLSGTDLEETTVYDALQQILTRMSSLEQTSEQFSFEFEEVQSTVDNLGNATAEANSKLSYVRITDEPAIILGTSESAFNAKITVDRISFMSGNTEIAYVSNDTLNISNAQIHDNLWFGNFKWFNRINGGIALRWEEDLG